MKRAIVYILSILFLCFQSCYIQRYKEIKEQYATFSKELNKVRNKNTALKQARQLKMDSIALFNKKAESMRIATILGDSMVEAYTKQIREKLGQDIWSDSITKAAQTAAKTTYMSKEEKDVLYWLNLARMQPDLYAELYVDPYQQLYDNAQWKSDSDDVWGIDVYTTYINTCYLYMAQLEPLIALVPDLENYKSAECHAIESGKTGYVGHDRTNCTEHFSAECCDYGPSEGFEVIHDLILDTGVPSLGHRYACLGRYSSIGIAQKSHLTYRYNTVLDFD